MPSRGRLPDRSYFEGCSTGGQQALSEAQRYPADYDGIVAGDPGHNRVRLILGFLWSWTAMHDADGTPILPASKLPLLTKAAVSACDASDGLQDGLISDPLTCQLRPRDPRVHRRRRRYVPDGAAGRRRAEGVSGRAQPSHW